MAWNTGQDEKKKKFFSSWPIKFTCRYIFYEFTIKINNHVCSLFLDTLNERNGTNKNRPGVLFEKYVWFK